MIRASCVIPNEIVPVPSTFVKTETGSPDVMEDMDAALDEAGLEDGINDEAIVEDCMAELSPIDDKLMLSAEDVFTEDKAVLVTVDTPLETDAVKDELGFD